MKFLLSIFVSLILMTNVAKSTESLILLIDISSSMNKNHVELQMNSYSEVMTMVAGLERTHIEVVVFEENPMLISSGNNLQAKAAFDSFEATNHIHRGSTCLGKALNLIETIVPNLKPPVVLDISGDGEANCNGDVRGSLDRLEKMGVQVNTLYINTQGPKVTTNKSIQSRNFYESLVRNGGFSITADRMMDFEYSLFEKLVLELAYNPD